ncbi:F-box/kelch-repeat protein At3g06240-like [Papaver somniferum]|uniref:F-box/kelch-repeat protein At3g06240-like n=1 Tax=Papaver somniferum TaxID=3469 RepID=UPI000E6F6C01|nr:F-box/kelch-repeat protein At3g06240-like [Papaver somniferum]XP_026399941.1 F-box/kelch-repeat protein At3g06240-like [Papaver somniferum]
MKNLNNFPAEILLEIITRLPTESIIDSKLVCRSWRDLVSHHPSFYQMYLSYLNQSAKSGKTHFLVKSKHQEHQCFEYNESHDETLNHSLRRFNFTLPFTSEYIIIGSINGLVCLYKADHISLICNPVTRKYVVLPKFERGCGESGDKYIHCWTGFGYLPLTNQYKVVLLYQSKREPSFIEAAVYTLGSGEGWRTVGKLELAFSICYAEPGVFANAALHWKENDEKGRVLVYDLTEEKFGEHLSPPSVPPDGRGVTYFIGELGGVLYYSIYYFNGDILLCDIWLLKEKNDIHDLKRQVEHEPLGWSKACTLPGKEPLAVTKSCGVLCYDYTSLNIYDAAASTSKKLVDFGAAISQIFSHKNTLVSLKELGEGDIRTMESAEIEERDP